jgi:hypothetical protein
MRLRGWTKVVFSNFSKQGTQHPHVIMMGEATKKTQTECLISKE